MTGNPGGVPLTSSPFPKMCRSTPIAKCGVRDDLFFAEAQGKLLVESALRQNNLRTTKHFSPSRLFEKKNPLLLKLVGFQYCLVALRLVHLKII